jgi:hypothetical protein
VPQRDASSSGTWYVGTQPATDDQETQLGNP